MQQIAQQAGPYKIKKPYSLPDLPAGWFLNWGVLCKIILRATTKTKKTEFGL